MEPLDGLPPLAEALQLDESDRQQLRAVGKSQGSIFQGAGESRDTTNKQIFWALNGGAFNGGQSVTVAAPPGDNALHVYRISFDDDINAPITKLRIDPSTLSGITSRIDFVRIYSEGPEITPPVASLDPATAGDRRYDRSSADGASAMAPRRTPATPGPRKRTDEHGRRPL